MSRSVLVTGGAGFIGGHVADAAGTAPDSRTYNVGTGRETSVLELARAMIEAAGRDVPVRRAETRPGELRHSSLDVTKLRSAGWEPRTALLEGLRKTLTHIEREIVAR